MRNHMLPKWILGIPSQRFSISCWLWKQMWMFSQNYQQGEGRKNLQVEESGIGAIQWGWKGKVALLLAYMFLATCSLHFSHFRPQNFKTVWINHGPVSHWTELPSPEQSLAELVQTEPNLPVLSLGFKGAAPGWREHFFSVFLALG